MTSRSWKLWLVLLVLLGLTGGFLVWRQRQPGAAAALDPAFAALGHPKRTVTLVLRAPAIFLTPLSCAPTSFL